jgi:hypothetical protein
MLWEEGQTRELRRLDDLLVIIQAGVREGMTDVYVALKRLRRKGKPARLIPDRHKRRGPTFDETWARLDMLSARFPGRVTSKERA